MRYYTLEEWRRRKNAGLGEADYELEKSDLIRAYDEMLRTKGAIIAIRMAIRLSKKLASIKNEKNAE